MHLLFCTLSFPEEAGDGVVEETGDGVEGHVGEVTVGFDTHSGDISGVGVALGNRDKGGKVGNNSKFSFIIRLNIPEKYLEYFNICSFACVHRYSIYTWLDISKVKVEKLRHLKIFKSFAPYRTVVLDLRYKDYGKTLRKCNAAAIIRYTFYIKLSIMDLFHYNNLFLTHF